ncbi:hypothetical protein PR048_018074 [Dryococelus australis]|uniref:Uncharacterized protein n=1 Tax=Dryococelus australis TaxID=614101 RepID=A0ABQ9HBE0_9NEOP|nr:hypothetical protein PR048_018074 [Dryococelus australis]
MEFCVVADGANEQVLNSDVAFEHALIFMISMAWDTPTHLHPKSRGQEHTQSNRHKEDSEQHETAKNGNRRKSTTGYATETVYVASHWPPADQKEAVIGHLHRSQRHFPVLRCALLHPIVVKRFGRLLTARSLEPMREGEVNVEWRRNERVGETGDPRDDPPTNGIVRNDSHLRKSGDPAGKLNPVRLGGRRVC